MLHPWTPDQHDTLGEKGHRMLTLYMADMVLRLFVSPDDHSTLDTTRSGEGNARTREVRAAAGVLAVVAWPLRPRAWKSANRRLIAAEALGRSQYWWSLGSVFAKRVIMVFLGYRYDFVG